MNRFFVVTRPQMIGQRQFVRGEVVQALDDNVVNRLLETGSVRDIRHRELWLMNRGELGVYECRNPETAKA